MSFHMKGAVDLGGATGIITTRKQFGSNANATAGDVVMFGNMSIPIEAAVKHGMLDKNGTTYTTLQPAQAATRVNS
jgi:hypothetical protein